MVRKAVAFLALALTIAAPARAWWEYGHQTVARIAWAYMTPAARAAATRLIAGSKALETPACPIRNIEDASVWPDCVKTLGDRFSYATAWHYQGIEICEAFDAKEACPDGNCITAQIARQARLLGDPKVPRRERLMALAFLVHFVGDLHQPLHVGEHDDAGGSAVKASYGAISYDKLNLHSVWDGLMAERLISEPPPLKSEITPNKRAVWEQGGIPDWARESWERARTEVYGKLPLPAPACAGKIEQRVSIGPDYIAAAREAVRTGVEQGGVRAALLINRALDPATQPKAPEPVKP